VAEIVSPAETVRRAVHDRDAVAMEGFTHLVPFAAGHEVIRRRRRELTLIRMKPDLIRDQLIGADADTTRTPRGARAHDDLAILELSSWYWQHFDDGDGAAPFTSAGRFCPAGRPQVAGRAELEEFVESAGQPGRMKPLTRNPIVDLGDAAATCRTDYLVIRIDESNRPFLDGCGRHGDEMVRHQSGWLFREQLINRVGSYRVAEPPPASGPYRVSDASEEFAHDESAPNRYRDEHASGL
jgi:hypothetical protein